MRIHKKEGKTRINRAVPVLAAAFLALAAAAPSWAQTPPQARPPDADPILRLSLDECIARTLKNNLGLAVEMLTPRLLDEQVALAGEKFFPTLTFAYSDQDTKTASYSFLDASDIVSTAQDENTTTLSQFLPTGGTLTASLYNYSTDSNRSFQTINPRYGSTLRFNFSQPLLKDFGFKAGRREIIVARYSRDMSEENFNAALENAIYNAESAYWNLVHSIESLGVRRQSLKLAEELLEKNKAELEAGTLAPIEILTAEAEVSLRRAEILEAEALVRNNEELVKTIINLAAERDDVKAVRVAPTDTPVADRTEVDFDGALVTALQKRPDLKALRLDVQSREFGVGMARNQLLPDVRLQLSYWSPGISGTRILYKDNNALSGIIVGKIEGKKSDALRDAFDFTYKNSALGFTVSLPVNTILSRAAYAQSRVGLDQAVLRVKNQEQQLTLELGNAVRAVETNYQRTEAYKAARDLAQRKLEAELEKFKVGLSTNYLVLQFQRDLANAQTLELKALIDYKISQAALDKVMGVGRTRLNVNVIEESE
ncbi:MAG: TolC family protein [Candidatus Aminicenantes bacterium]|nr:TolC family protein [Candidatus Aminicenantes bacterium]